MHDYKGKRGAWWHSGRVLNRLEIEGSLVRDSLLYVPEHIIRCLVMVQPRKTEIRPAMMKIVDWDVKLNTNKHNNDNMEREIFMNLSLTILRTLQASTGCLH